MVYRIALLLGGHHHDMTLPQAGFLRGCHAHCPNARVTSSLTSLSPRQCIALRWRHNDGDSVSNHQPHDCLLSRLFGRTSTKTSKLRVTGLCAGNSPWTGEFPAQMASNAENVSIWWRHHGVDTSSTLPDLNSPSLVWGPCLADCLTLILNGEGSAGPLKTRSAQRSCFPFTLVEGSLAQPYGASLVPVDQAA